MRGDNLPILDLSKYHTDGKEAHYIQINHIVGRNTENKKLTEENIKKAELNFMLDLKTLISKTAIDPEMTRVRASIGREEKNTAPEGYGPVFDKFSLRWGLVFVDDEIAFPIDLRTLEYSTPAWLDDIIVVTRGNRQEHEKELFDVLSKLEKTG